MNDKEMVEAIEERLLEVGSEVPGGSSLRILLAAEILRQMKWARDNWQPHFNDMNARISTAEYEKSAGRDWPTIAPKDWKP